MLVTRVKLPEKKSVQTDGYSGILTRTDKDNNMSKELVDYKISAKAYKVINGLEVLFSNPKTYSNQDYEAPAYTSEQNKLYKDILYSKKGNKLLNRLKNTSLIKRSQLNTLLAEAKVNNKLIKKIEQIFFPTPMTRKIDFRVEEGMFNRLSFKDLGITKQKIMTLFINEGLIPAYGKK